MDSMRHLSTSLPRTARRQNEPDTLSSFKAAALSVTNLYRAAAADKAQAREAGYQDALDDLLAFLDKDKIGLGDGEGWAVRKWILERLEDAPSSKHNASEDDEDVIKPEDNETRYSSPEAPRKGINTSSLDSETSDTTEKRPASEPPQQAPPIAIPSLEDFSFRAATQMPTNHDREVQQTMDLDMTPTMTTTTTTTTTRPVTRHARPRHNRRDNRGNTPSFNLTVASSVNGKRKFPYGDFFDISNINFDSNDNKKDGSRGGKRGRFV